MFSYPVSIWQTTAPEAARKPIKWHLQRIGWQRRRFPETNHLPQIQRINFSRWTLTLNSRIVFLVRVPLSGGSFRTDFCVQPCKLRCKSADLVVLPLNL